MSGSIRVIHIRTPAEDTAGEIIIRGDRSNPILGNPHRLYNKVDVNERAHVIGLYRRDVATDIARNGPIAQEIARIAQLVRDGNEIALACHCAPLACHLDVIAEMVRRHVDRHIDQK